MRAKTSPAATWPCRSCFAAGPGRWSVARTWAGLVLFLRLKVECPLGQLLTLLAEQGIAPIRNLSLHINRLLHGLTHDLGGLRTEILCERLSGENGELSQAMALDLEQLRELTDQLALLGEQELPAERRQPCALDDLCGRIVASHPSLLIKLRLPGLLVNLDPEGVQRALNNLIDNALEYGAPPVELSAVRRGSDLQLRVDDHGAGIPTESLLEILGPSRSNDANARGIGGWLTGLLRAPCWPENGPGPWPELGWP
jgi:signal transduction histidine kinase